MHQKPTNRERRALEFTKARAAFLATARLVAALAVSECVADGHAEIRVPELTLNQFMSAARAYRLAEAALREP